MVLVLSHRVVFGRDKRGLGKKNPRSLEVVDNGQFFAKSHEEKYF
jgi:hypothetical protein